MSSDCEAGRRGQNCDEKLAIDLGRWCLFSMACVGFRLWFASDWFGEGGRARRALAMYPPRCDKISPRLKITLSARYRNSKQPNERPRSDTSGSSARQKGTAALRAIVFMSWRRHSYKARGRRGATAGGSETRPYGRKAMTKATELREAFLKPRSKPPIRSLASPGNGPACSAGRLQRQESLGGAAELLQFLLGARLDVIAAWRAVRCVRRQKF
jgi:hypothetical protein